MSDLNHLMLLCHAAEERISRRLADNERDRAQLRRLREQIYRACPHEWEREAVRNEAPQQVCNRCGLYRVY